MPLRIVYPHEPVQVGVKMVVTDGFVPIEGYESHATPYQNAVVADLEANHADVDPAPDYFNVKNRGYLYVVYDRNHFSTRNAAEAAVKKFDLANPVL